MKYLRKFNEASKSANDYKFRRDILPSEIEDILTPLKDESIEYKITFPTINMRKIEIDFMTDKTLRNISKDFISPILHHLIEYLISEDFELTYYWTEIESSDITTPEFSSTEFIDLLPLEFPNLHLAFNYKN